MSVSDDLNQVVTDLTTAQAAVSQAVTDLSVPATDSVGDQVLAAIVPVLEAAGYTVTPPATTTSIPVTDGDASTESTTEDSTDTSTES